MTTASLSNFVGGSYVATKSGASSLLVDPSTGEENLEAPVSGAEDVDGAMAAAAAAFPGWRDATPSERSLALFRIADAIEARAEELVATESANTGKPLAVTLAEEIPPMVDQIRFFAGAARHLEGKSAGEYMADHTSMIRREPIGVCAAVTPWNYPAMMAVWKWAPAIAAGNAMVLKPSDTTPASTLLMAEIMSEFLPDGVFNVVCGDRDTGRMLVEHPTPAMVSITGSVRAGMQVAESAAHDVKRVHLELGGKAPVVVFDDADIARTVQGASMGIFVNAGQVCVAGSRLYVQRKVFDKVVTGIADVARSMTLGGSFDPAAQVGPLISARQLERVTGLIDSGLNQGAELVVGGKRHGSQGYFVEPTILANPQPGARIVREEIFGPVLTAMPFDDINDIARIANDTSYGLASAVWTNDINKAHLLARKLQAGIVWINCEFVSDPGMPFGGYKQSGWGKEMGPEGIEAYLQTKSVFAALT